MGCMGQNWLKRLRLGWKKWRGSNRGPPTWTVIPRWCTRWRWRTGSGPRGKRPGVWWRRASWGFPRWRPPGKTFQPDEKKRLVFSRFDSFCKLGHFWYPTGVHYLLNAFCKPIRSSLVSSPKRNPTILNSKFNSLYEVEVFFSFLPLFHWKRLLACRIPSALVLYRINVLVEPPYATDPQYLLRWSRCLSSYPLVGFTH